MNILVNTAFALKREKLYPFANQSHYIYMYIQVTVNFN